MKLAVLPVHTAVIKDALCMPRDYEIVGISFDVSTHIVNLTIQSETFPDTPDGHRLPELSANAHSVTLPFADPDYRKITVEYSVRDGQVSTAGVE